MVLLLGARFLDTPITRIKTGSYVGDGADSRAITGLGFKPKYVKITRDPDADWDKSKILTRIDSMSTQRCIQVLDLVDTDVIVYEAPLRIISLDSDGFTVGDGTADQDPNKDGQKYVYLAIG